MKLWKCLIYWLTTMRLLGTFTFLKFFFFIFILLSLIFLFFLRFLLQIKKSLINRNSPLFDCLLVYLRFSSCRCLLFFFNFVFNLFLVILFEFFLVFQKLFSRAVLIILSFNNLRTKSAMFSFWVHYLLALLFNSCKSSLFPLFKSAVVILFIF